MAAAYTCFLDHSSAHGVVVYSPSSCSTAPSGYRYWAMPLPTDSIGVPYNLRAWTNVYAGPPATIPSVSLTTFTHDGVYQNTDFVTNATSGDVGPLQATVPVGGYGVLIVGLQFGGQAVRSYAYEYEK